MTVITTKVEFDTRKYSVFVIMIQKIILNVITFCNC